MSTFNRNQIIVSTTSTLDGWAIDGYLDVVSARVVAGTNVFSDIAASFSDVFGGRSSSYQKQLADINEQVLSDLQAQATRVGADALIGVKVDHDEISGGNRQLLMVTATGTAVRASKRKTDRNADVSAGAGLDAAGDTAGDAGSTDSNASPSRIGADEMRTQMRKARLLRASEKGKLRYTEDVWRFLIRNAVEDLAKEIRETVNVHLNRPESLRSDEDKQFIKYSRDYFGALPVSDAKNHLYNLAAKGNRNEAEYATELIVEQRLLDWAWINTLMDTDVFQHSKRTLPILTKAHKPYYTENDMGHIQRTVERLHNDFPKQGEVIEVEKSGMFASGTEKKWTIDGGMHISMDRTYDPQTGQDIYGFESHEVRPDAAIERLTRMYDALSQ